MLPVFQTVILDMNVQRPTLFVDTCCARKLLLFHVLMRTFFEWRFSLCGNAQLIGRPTSLASQRKRQACFHSFIVMTTLYLPNVCLFVCSFVHESCLFNIFNFPYNVLSLRYCQTVTLSLHCPVRPFCICCEGAKVVGVSERLYFVVDDNIKVIR
jgi:hypothetical protein